MTVGSISSSVLSALVAAPKTAAPVDRPNDGDGDDAKVQAAPAAGTGSKVDITA